MKKKITYHPVNSSVNLSKRKVTDLTSAIEIDIDDDAIVTLDEVILTEGLDYPNDLGEVELDIDYTGSSISYDIDNLYQDVVDVITTVMPNTPGTYHIKGSVSLLYNIKDVYEDELDDSIDTSEAYADLDFRNSSADLTEIDKISDNTDYE